MWRGGRAWAAVVAAMALVAAQVATGGSAGAEGTTSPLSSWNVKVLPVPARDLAYDTSRDVLLASVPGSQRSLGNELVELDPETGAIGRRVFVGSEPGPIAVTDDGTTAYVGLQGVNQIARVDLATFTLSASFTTASDGFFGPSYVEDIEAVPGRNDMVAASLMKPGFSPRHEGVWVFEDGVAAGTHTPGHTGANRIEFGDATNLYGYNNETTEFGFRRIAVSSSGATEVDSGSSAIAGFGVDIELVAGRVYSTTGIILDPRTRTALGSFGSSGLVEVTAADQRATFLDGATVRVFDAATTAPIGSRTLPDMPTTSTALVASGTGFAVASPDGVRLLGPAVGGAAISLPPPPASTIDDLKVVSIGVHAADVIHDDLRQRVYASVRGSSPAHANSVLSIDSATGAIVGSVFVGSEPGPLALTGDGSVLYVGQSAIGRVASLLLPTLAPGPSFFIGNASYSGVLVAEDIEVQPGTTTTLAISLSNQCCSPRHEGVAVFDNGVKRPLVTPGHTGANRIEFGATPGVLYGTNNETTGFDYFNMAVTADGVSRIRTTGYLLPSFGTEIEITDGRLYASNGLVADPDAARLVGRYGTSGAVEMVPAAGRAYIAGSSTLTEFVAARFTQVAQRSIDFGFARAMVRTASGLAVAGDGKLVVLTRSAEVAVPAPIVAGVAPSSGPTSGSTHVTISGSGFTNASAVRFGSTSAASFSVVSDGQISAFTPSHVAASVSVSVTSPGGTGSRADGYTFVSSTTTTTTPTTAPPPPPSGGLRVDRASVGFGEQRVNTFDPEGEPVRITNGSASTVSILGFEFLGDQTWDGVTDCPTALAPAQSCTVVLAFFPSAMRSYSGSFRVHAGSGPPASVALSGSGTTGYFTATNAATLRGFGDAWPMEDGVGARLTLPVVGMATTPNGDGQWMVASDGGIFSFGDASFFGSTGAMRLNQPIVGMASTPTGDGYWLVASDGGIFTFGDAEFFGSTGAIRLNKPIVGMAATPSGDGYWLVASDGGIFSFGDAPFLGSTGDIKLNQPIVGMAPSGTGDGYWFVASDGGIFTFGDAPFFGSTGHIRLNEPIVGMAASPTGEGYWFVARDGGVFTFGDAAFHGSAPSSEPVVAMAGTAPVIGGGGLAAQSSIGSRAPGGHGRVLRVDSLDGAVIGGERAVANRS